MFSAGRSQSSGVSACLETCTHDIFICGVPNAHSFASGDYLRCNGNEEGIVFSLKF